MAELVVSTGLAFAERALVPDAVIRAAIRAASRNRLRTVERACDGSPERALKALVRQLAEAPIAEATAEANAQHYELPPGFFEIVLGPRRKYSCCEWGSGVETLAQAENRALQTIVQRARIEDGQRVLDLGCGWGSLSLFLAQRFPKATIVGVSNSAPQRAFILDEARRLGLENLEIRTADVNTFEPRATFDRIVSIEMLEHVRNHRTLFGRLAGWLDEGGLAFFHVFRHARFPYTFDTEGSGNWMGRHFFTGGIMPSPNLFAAVQSDLALVEQWELDGTHYERTANAWLENLDAHREAILAIFRDHYGEEQAARWLQRWRIFFMACAEMFGLDKGREWGVTHGVWRKA